MFSLALVAAALLVSPSHRCSIAVSPFNPGPHESYFWAVFTEDVVFAGTHYPRPPQPGHWSNPDSSSATWGQVVRIGGFGGAGSRWFNGGGKLPALRQAIVVLWDYDPGCEPTPFPGPKPWGIPGDTAFLRASPRTRNLWIQNTPTFDAYWAGETVYPFRATVHGREFGEYMAQEYPDWRSRRGAAKLSPVAVFDLLIALPQPCDYTYNREAAAEQYRAVARAWPSPLADTPAEEILRTHESFSTGAANYWQDRCAPSRRR